jgi:polysaccharide pyruvyl transferase WcaK-like protein
LNRHFNYANAIKTIESIDAPVATIALGAQAKRPDPHFLDDIPEARTFAHMLSERSTSISVRGEFTAAVLESLGVTNVRVTGCPSIFYSLSAPSVSIPETLRGEGRRLGVSIHTGLRNGIFCRNPRAAMRMHGRVLSYALQSAASMSFFEQGVPTEHAVANETLDMAERLRAAETILERFPRAALRPSDLVNHMVSVRSVEEWLDRAGELDAMIGFRFHGNMVALTQGVPCFYYVYDTRLSEFCQLYRLPHMGVEEKWRDPVKAILEHDWDDSNRAIQACLSELIAFYDGNGIDHRLHDVR